MSEYRGRQFGFSQVVAVGTADYELVAAPDATQALVVQHLSVDITVANAATCNIEDDAASSPVVVFAIPTNLAVGHYEVNCGPVGQRLTAGQALQWDASGAGIGATVSGYGYVA